MAEYLGWFIGVVVVVGDSITMTLGNGLEKDAMLTRATNSGMVMISCCALGCGLCLWFES